MDPEAVSTYNFLQPLPNARFQPSPEAPSPRKAFHFCLQTID
jgi:hypothetical protein